MFPIKNDHQLARSAYSLLLCVILQNTFTNIVINFMTSTTDKTIFIWKVIGMALFLACGGEINTR